MTAAPAAVHLDADIHEVASTMFEFECRHLPVLSEDDSQVIGMVSIRDLLGTAIRLAGRAGLAPPEPWPGAPPSSSSPAARPRTASARPRRSGRWPTQPATRPCSRRPPPAAGCSTPATRSARSRARS